MNNTSKRVSILITTNSGTHMSDGAVEEIILSSAFSIPEVIDDPEYADEPSDDDASAADTGQNSIEQSSEDESFAPVAERVNDSDRYDTPMMLSVIGKLTHEDGVTTLTYNESELTNMDGSVTIISFSDPDEVTMVREGSARTALCFNAKKERRICCYNNSFFPIELAVITEKFKNDLNVRSGGVLDVTYSVEMKGIPIENTRLRVRVSPLRDY